MITEASADETVAAENKRIDFGSFFVFLNSFRWLNWALAVLLLYVGATPKMPPAITIAVYLSVFLYNCLFTFWSAKLERALRKFPALLLADIIFCFLLLVAYGWRSPFTVYSFSPVMLAGYLYKVQGGFIAAALTALAYGLSVALNGYTWEQIKAMGEVDGHLFHYFDYFLVAIFFSYPAVLAEKLRQSNKELTDAQAQIERLALAKERQRLAADIHDSVTQSLFSINMTLEDAAKACAGDEKLSRRLNLAREAAARALSEIRLAIDDLFGDRYASQSLRELAGRALQNLRQHHDLAANLVFSGTEVHLEPEIKKELYLVLQEALSNVLKHAQASRVDVSLDSKEYALTLEIIDDGEGFCAEDAECGYGLKMISRRIQGMSGVCEICSVPNEGTRIVVRVPLPVALGVSAPEPQTTPSL